MTETDVQADLATWLLAQIDDDDRVARGVERPRVLDLLGWPRRWRRLGSTWSPLRLRDECNSKRKLVEHVRDSIAGWREDSCTPADDAACAIADLEHVLRLLALPYFARDGYLDSWAPDGR